jgi:hypothetical protein
MKNAKSKPRTLIQTIITIGTRAILISILVQVLLCILAVFIGTIMGMKHDLLIGMVSGLLAFMIGQSFVYLLLDFIFFLPDEPMEKTPSTSDEEELDALKRELGYKLATPPISESTAQHMRD